MARSPPSCRWVQPAQWLTGSRCPTAWPRRRTPRSAARRAPRPAARKKAAKPKLPSIQFVKTQPSGGGGPGPFDTDAGRGAAVELTKHFDVDLKGLSAVVNQTGGYAKRDLHPCLGIRGPSDPSDPGPKCATPGGCLRPAVVHRAQAVPKLNSLVSGSVVSRRTWP
jgi:hypothetical protein